MSEEVTIWALKIQPNSADENATPYEFCKQRSIIGTGWGLNQEFESKESALDAHRRNGSTDHHGNVRFSIRAMIAKASTGDYVWVNENSEYALCRIESDWRHHPTGDDEWTTNDIHNYREATWRIIPPRLVPGYIKRYFSSPQVLPMARPGDAKNRSAKRYAIELFEHCSDDSDEIVSVDSAKETVESAEIPRVFELLDPVETEDIVIDYLQSKGWHVVKSSTSRAQAGIECVLRRRAPDPKTAYVQVKSGNASVEIEDYIDLAADGIVYIHQKQKPTRDLPDTLVWISPSEIYDHIVSNMGYLPEHTMFKLDWGLKHSFSG